ncbi:MAG: hypothetical protein QM751_04275 [Paludibacteraceae bacterium]
MKTNNQILILLSFLLFLAVNPSKAQNEKNFLLEAALGNSSFVGQSNLSPFGAHYRDNHNNGLSLDAKVLYVFSDNTTTGIKYNSFSVSGNYELDLSNKIADNVNTFYLAPQLGTIYFIKEQFSFRYLVGLGYLYYFKQRTNFCK